MKAKKRNPNDATMRNVRAANSRIDRLERQLTALRLIIEGGALRTLDICSGAFKPKRERK